MSAFAVYGGTFDPVHCGHLRIALEVLERLSLDEVRLMPAPNPRLRGAPRAEAGTRLEMLDAAVDGVPGLAVDRGEVDAASDAQPTRSVETLQRLRASAPDACIGFVVGADALARLDEWHAYDKLPELAHLVVVQRPGAEVPDSGPVAELLAGRRREAPASFRAATCGYVFDVAAPALDISASRLRAYVSSGRRIDFLTPPAVREVIEREQLYQHAS